MFTNLYLKSFSKGIIFICNQKIRSMAENYLNNKQTNNKKKNQTNRQGDWVCQLCNNYNYSFRLKCNRCQVQTKQSNNALQSFYDENNYYYQNAIREAENLNNWFCSTPQKQSNFPKVLFLSLSDDPWDLPRQQQMSRRQMSELDNLVWINQLIQD